MRRILIVATVVVVLSVATACSTDDQGQGISGTLTPIKSFKPAPVGPCDMESRTVLAGVAASRFRAWNRVRDGHKDQVAVGHWPLPRTTAVRQLQALKAARDACAVSDNVIRDYSIDPTSYMEPSNGFYLDRLHGLPPLHAGRVYQWANGYMVTAWLQSTSGEQEQSDLQQILKGELRKLRAGK